MEEEEKTLLFTLNPELETRRCKIFSFIFSGKLISLAVLEPYLLSTSCAMLKVCCPRINMMLHDNNRTIITNETNKQNLISVLLVRFCSQNDKLYTLKLQNQIRCIISLSGKKKRNKHADMYRSTCKQQSTTSASTRVEITSRGLSCFIEQSKINSSYSGKLFMAFYSTDHQLVSSVFKNTL